jgi:hypothetical protein
MLLYAANIYTLKPIIQYASLVGPPFPLPFAYWTSQNKVLTQYVPSTLKLRIIECYPYPHISYGSYNTQQFLPRGEKQSISRAAGSNILNVIQINFRLQKD